MHGQLLKDGLDEDGNEIQNFNQFGIGSLYCLCSIAYIFIAYCYFMFDQSDSHCRQFDNSIMPAPRDEFADFPLLS